MISFSYFYPPTQIFTVRSTEISAKIKNAAFSDEK